jgi:RNA polymerase sigma factor (sigma-70 family)
MKGRLRSVSELPEVEVTDDELIARMAAQDSVAMGTFFARHHRALYGFVRRVAGAAGADLDDVVQNTFVEAYRGAHRFRGGASGRTWLFAIASNVARSQRRSGLRRLRAFARLTWQPSRATTTPLETMERDHELARVARALDAMAHDLRVAYVMHVIEEMPADEVGLALGVPRGTVWRRVHEARLILRRALERGEPS